MPLVVVIDDTDEIRSLMKLVLARDGYQVMDCLLYTSPSPRDS